MTEPYYSALHYAAKAEKSALQAKEYRDKVEDLSTKAQNAATSATTNAEMVTNAVSEAIEARDRAEKAAATSENAITTTLENANAAFQSAGAAATSETNAAASASSASASEQACQAVLDRVGTVIKIKGRVETVDDLPINGNIDGDAYLVGSEGQESYPEYYWFHDHWEFLGTTEAKVAWGAIQGNINDQEDLINTINEIIENKFQVVVSLPSTPDADTFYFIPEA
ncbi:MAG: hypothetical protein NC124_02035 [Clostridium sp.]|nr:hypothetical protein [Clostridium sp.]